MKLQIVLSILLGFSFNTINSSSCLLNSDNLSKIEKGETSQFLKNCKVWLAGVSKPEAADQLFLEANKFRARRRAYNAMAHHKPSQRKRRAQQRFNDLEEKVCELQIDNSEILALEMLALEKLGLETLEKEEEERLIIEAESSENWSCIEKMCASDRLSFIESQLNRMWVSIEVGERKFIEHLEWTERFKMEGSEEQGRFEMKRNYSKIT